MELPTEQKRNTLLLGFSFLLSTATLLCCTLPILLITLGLGTTLAAITSQWTVLPLLSAHKFWIFFISGIILLIADIVANRPQTSCPVDPEQAKKCMRVRQFHKTLFWSAVTLWAIGFFSAYLAVPVALWIEG